VCEHFTLFGSARGSILVGPNDRSSSLSVVTPANPGTTTSRVLTENKTDFIPAGEFEVGLIWGTVLRTKITPAPVGTTGTLIWARFSLLAEIWGDLGLLPISDPTNRFADGSLFLYGFAVAAGINY
jgi:hypothetical protein